MLSVKVFCQGFDGSLGGRVRAQLCYDWAGEVQGLGGHLGRELRGPLIGEPTERRIRDLSDSTRFSCCEYVCKKDFIKRIWVEASAPEDVASPKIAWKPMGGPI